MTIIKPTIGRMLWMTVLPGTGLYARYERFAKNRSLQMSATITHVWSDSLVNLMVFPPSGLPFDASSVDLIQDGQYSRGENYCEWMPYQKAVTSGQIPPTLHAQDEVKSPTQPFDACIHHPSLANVPIGADVDPAAKVHVGVFSGNKVT